MSDIYTEQERAQAASNFANTRLCSLLQKRVVLELILQEAGLAFYTAPGTDKTRLIKLSNVSANVGKTAELALADVVIQHLKVKP